MPRPKKKTLDVADANLTGFASNVTGATWTLTATAATDNLAHQVSIRNDSATDHSGKTAILTGTCPDGRTLTETVTLPAGSATVESTNYFLTLTSVVPSATIGADTMDIGWVDEVSSSTFPLNWRSSEVAISTGVTGTINYTLQQTFDNVQDDVNFSNQSEFTWTNSTDSNLVAATASQITNYDKMPTAIRFIINSYSSGAELDYWIVQSDD